MRHCKLLLAATTAIAVLGALATTASARNISTSSQTLRAQFREVRIEGINGLNVCQVTLEGSLHSRTIAKVREALIGYITAARLGPCSVGRATILTETLPWHMTYDSFTGTLPNIQTIRTRLINYSERRTTNTGENCLLRSTTTNPLIITYNVGAGGVINTANIEGENIPTECGFGNLPSRFRSDSGPVTVLNSTTRVTVRLI